MDLSQKEAAQVLGVSEKTIQRLIQSRRLLAMDVPGPRQTRLAEEQAIQGKRKARVGGVRKEIALDDLRQLIGYSVDEGQVALIKAQRERGDPTGAILHLRLSEDRLSVIERRLATMEEDRDALATDNAQLRAAVDDLRVQLRAITQRFDAFVRSDAPTKAPEAILTDERPPAVNPPFSFPGLPAAARVSAHPLQENVAATTPTHRHGDGASAHQKWSRWSDRPRTTDYPEWTPESGYMPFTPFLEGHRIAATTASKQVHKGVFERKQFLIGRAAGAYAIDQENALLALRYWQERGLLAPDRIGQCGVKNCPCSVLNGAK